MLDSKHPGGRVNDPGAWATCGKQANVSDRTCDSCGATKSIIEFPFAHPGARREVERRTTCRICWERARRRACYLANRMPHVRDRSAIPVMSLEERRACQKSWRIANREHCLAKLRKWREDNREGASRSQAEWRRNNAARKRANDRAYCAANKERIRERGREYHLKNRDVIIQRVRAWAAANPERRRKTGNDYRSRKYAAEACGVPFTAEQLVRRISYYGDRCWVCHGEWTDLDHVKPLKRGGPNLLANLRPICRPCNSTKHAAWPMDDVRDRLRHRLNLRPQAVGGATPPS